MTQSSAPTDEKLIEKFSDLDISQELKKGIKELGYVTPTSFQLSIFDSFRRGHNVVGEGQSNYGKSLAFSLPILSKIEASDQNLQALVISETALQSEICAKEYRALGRFLDIHVTNSLDAFLAKNGNLHIVVFSAEDFKKADAELFAPVTTVFLDNLSAASTKIALEQLARVPGDKKQLLVYGKETAAQVSEHAGDLLENAVFISNNDQPKIAMPAKHIYHQPKEAEPKPRALLAALELHRPKFALVTCHEAQECDLLSRYLSRYGYRIRVVSADYDRKSLADALRQGVQGSFDVLLCQNSLLPEQNLEDIAFMINYDMFDRPQSYEHATQFNKQAPSLQRTIVSLLTSRETGYLGPIKAHCLIDFTLMPLPSDDEVMSLVAIRIIENLNREANEVELGQFETLAQKILDDESAKNVLSLLLRNHLMQMNAKPKAEGEVERFRDSRPSRNSRAPFDRKRGERRNDRNDRDRDSFRDRDNKGSYEREESNDEQVNRNEVSQDGVARLYVTLGKRDGLDDLASLAQYLSDKSGVDLGHFSGSGMVRDHSAHIEVDEDVAEDIIKSLHETERPHRDGAPAGDEPNLVICERARATPQRQFRRPQRRRPNFKRRA